MGRLIINCDLGEDEPTTQTEQLLALVDAANIGCGFHAGCPEKTRATIQSAIKHGVQIGAHPGLALNSGRGNALPSSKEFSELLESQLSSFIATANSLGAKVDYIKLHGSLYHAVEGQPELAEVYCGFLKQCTPKLAVVALAGGAFAKLAESAGIHVYNEAFADRDYLANGSLVPRSEKGSVLSEKAALERFMIWGETGMMPTRDGRAISLEANTLCVHGDSPGAVEMIRKIQNLRKHGI